MRVKSFRTDISEGGWKTVAHERGIEKERNEEIYIKNHVYTSALKVKGQTN